MLEEVIAGALANVISEVLSATSRQLGAAWHVSNERRHHAELQLAGFFNTYEFTQNAAPELARRLSSAISSAETDAVVKGLDSDRCHAVLHELLAARLTDAPEQQLDRLRSSFRRALWPLGGLSRDAARQTADAVFEYFDDELSAVVARVEGALPDPARQLRDRAIGHRIVALLDAIERHEAALVGDWDDAADQAFQARYRRHLAEDFGTLSPPDLHQRRRIPIEDLYVPPKIALIPQSTDWDTPRVPPLSLLTEFTSNIDRTVLLGDPGAGKTTAARALIHAHARDGAVIPFLVTLRDFAADETTITRSVVQHIEQVMNAVYQCVPPRGWVQRQLLDGAALVVFDGLDELVDTGRRAQVSSVIEHFCLEYPLVRVLVTSRFVGYDEARLDERDFIRYRIDRFDDEQVAEYARKWFASDRTLTADQAAKDAAAFVTESASVPDLRSNPLMLSLMCLLYRGEGYIPQHRAQVYRMCADLLFHRWDASRHIHVALTLSQAQVQRLLRALAHWLLTREDTSTAVTERQLVAKTAELLLARDTEQPEQAETAAVEFVTFCRGRGWIFVDVGTTATGEPLYAFAHRTFMEYFAAAHLAAHADTPEALARTLIPRLVRGEWDLIAQLAIAMKDDAIAGGGQRVLEALLGDRRYTSDAARSKLLLTAASCLNSVDLTPQYVKEFTHSALDYILDPTTDLEARNAVLAWLRFNVRRWRELVAAKITARAESLIASEDSHVRAIGFQLGAGTLHPMTKVDNADLSFWADWSRTNALTWHESIERDAASDISVMQLALDHGLLSVREVLDQPDGVFRLTASYNDPLLGHSYSAQLDECGFDVRLARTLEGPALRACQDFGAYLLEANPRPPFAEQTSWAIAGGDGYAGRELSPEETVSEPVYLAVAMLTAIEVESRMRHEPPSAIVVSVARETETDGWLSALIPYLRVRLDAGAKVRLPLTPLPVREDYQQLFNAWAYRKVDFTRAPDESTDADNVTRARLV